MLRGLIIRQAFLALDFTLAVIVAGLACMVIAKVLTVDQRDRASANAAPPDNHPVVFAKVEPRPKYDAIIQSGLFGDAARRSKSDEPDDTAPVAPVEKSAGDLHLRLWGATASHPTDPLATAVIENGSFKTTDTYYLGEVVMDQIKLIEVYKRKVILFNEATRERLFLDMEEEAPGPRIRAAAAPRRTARLQPPPPSRSARVSIAREDINDMAQNYGEVMAQINPRLYKDESGAVAGITGDNLGSIPLAQKLGLQDGDVIQTVNGIAIDSEQKVFEIVTKFRSLDTFRVGVLRNGKPQMITFKLD